MHRVLLFFFSLYIYDSLLLVFSFTVYFSVVSRVGVFCTFFLMSICVQCRLCARA